MRWNQFDIFWTAGWSQPLNFWWPCSPTDMFLWDLCSQLHRYSPGRYSLDPWNCWTRFGTWRSMSFFGKRDLGGRGWKVQSLLCAWWEEADLGLLRQPYGEQLERDPPRRTLSSSPLHLWHPHIVPGLQHAALAQSKEVKASSVNSFAQDSVQSKAEPDCRFEGVPHVLWLVLQRVRSLFL